jgi:hypothetical protein
MNAAASGPVGPDRSGVYLSPASMRDLRAAAARAELAWFAVDLAGVADKVHFLAQCAERLGFPDYFGRNWDAFADCLQDFSWRPAAGYVIHLKGAADFAAGAPAEWAVALEILRDAATFWSERGTAFITLADGIAGLPDFPP